MTKTLEEIKVADEVFLVAADLHRSRPDAVDFSIEEIIEHGVKLGLTKEMRPGFKVHVYLHCVANKSPNPGNYRILFATAKSRRRLLKPGDSVDPARKGKIFPDPADVPPRFAELIEWAKKRYESAAPEAQSFYDRLAALRGSGRGLWPEGGDKFVEDLRSGW